MEKQNEDLVVLRLYVNGRSATARSIVDRLRYVLEKHLCHSFDLEVVDVSNDPARLEMDDVIALPTLIRLGPGIVYRFVGDLTNEDLMLKAFGVAPTTA